MITPKITSSVARSGGITEIAGNWCRLSLKTTGIGSS
jgi:hypothetical protein